MQPWEWDLKVLNNMTKHLMENQKSNGLKRCFACFGYEHDDTQCPNKEVTTYEEYKEFEKRWWDPYRCYMCKGLGHHNSVCATRRMVPWKEIDAPKEEEKKVDQEEEAKNVATFKAPIKTGESGKDKSDHADKIVHNFHMEETHQEKLVSLDSKKKDLQLSYSEKELKLNGDASKDEEKKTLSGNLGFDETAPSEQNDDISQIIDIHKTKQIGEESQLDNLELSCLELDLNPITTGSKSELNETHTPETGSLTHEQCLYHNFPIPTLIDIIPTCDDSQLNGEDLLCSNHIQEPDGARSKPQVKEDEVPTLEEEEINDQVLNDQATQPDCFVHNFSMENDNAIKPIGLYSQLNRLSFLCLDQPENRDGKPSKSEMIQQLLQPPGRLTFVAYLGYNSNIKDPFEVKRVPYERRHNFLQVLCSQEDLLRKLRWSKPEINWTYVQEHVQIEDVNCMSHNSSVSQWNEIILGSKESLRSPLQLFFRTFSMGTRFSGSNFAYKSETCNIINLVIVGSNQSSATKTWMDLYLCFLCKFYEDNRKILRRHIGVFESKPKFKMRHEEVESRSRLCVLMSKAQTKHLYLREAHIHEGYMNASILIELLQKFNGKISFFQEGENDAGACPTHETHDENNGHNFYIRHPNATKQIGLDFQLNWLQLLCSSHVLNRKDDGSNWRIKQTRHCQLDSFGHTHYFDHNFPSTTPNSMIQSSNETTFNYLQLSCFEELVNQNGEGPNIQNIVVGLKESRVACSKLGEQGVEGEIHCLGSKA